MSGLLTQNEDQDLAEQMSISATSSTLKLSPLIQRSPQPNRAGYHLADPGLSTTGSGQVSVMTLQGVV